MPTPALQAREQREREIVAATRRLFDDRGVQEAEVDAIARAVGINKALIYRHVSSKEELFVLALASYLDELRTRARTLPADMEPADALRAHCDVFVGFCLEYPAFLDCAMSLMRRPARGLRDRLSPNVWFRLGRAMVQSLAPLVAVLRALGVDEPDYVANRIYVQVLGTMHLARVGVGVREVAPGVPDAFRVEAEQVRRECVDDAVALALRAR